MRRRIRGMLLSGRQFSLDSRIDLVQGTVHGTVQGVLAEDRPELARPELPLMREDSVEANHEHDGHNSHHPGQQRSRSVDEDTPDDKQAPTSIKVQTTAPTAAPVAK
ncbi:uncharacterized protein LOC127748907 [Frankliniella occidentalis]|uniref:Uncharacterized protein LOC127748907 n=1 Tax=Frankliniella occidentalis TaxID=133901 RepID=A0A9C6TUF0_FRAOC|nr:uncharacterized protein LOC127748907 [Frankliniella occidentalis]